jgi:hypothetical protein
VAFGVQCAAKKVDAKRSGCDGEFEIFSVAYASEALKMASLSPKVWKSASRSSFAMLLALISGSIANAQTASNAATQQSNASSDPATAEQSKVPSKPWIVRDSATGRLFQQQLVPVGVPVTRWEPRTIEQTVYEPRIATQIQQIPQTTYVPSTQYVMQPKVSGWWNPFKQPVQAYQYTPVTSWVPQTRQVPNPVPTQQWVPRQQKIVVYQQVQATEIRQQLVQTELPQPQTAPTAIAARPAYTTAGLRPIASPRRPLVLPPFALPLNLPRFASSPYSAPLQTTSSVSTIASRDAFQSGMQPTVLR